MSNPKKIKIENNLEGQMLPNQGLGLIISQKKPNAKELRLLEAKLKDQQLQAKPLLQPVGPFQTQPASGSERPIFEDSIAGRFGWAELRYVFPNHLFVLPYIIRGSEKFCPERIFKMVLREYLSRLNPDIGKCTSSIRKLSIFRAELNLLNEINTKHCDGQFGEPFTPTESVVRLGDALDCIEFMAECLTMLGNTEEFAPTRCGFFQVQGAASVLPYTVSGGQYLVPLFCCEIAPGALMSKTKEVQGWDLAYLKFCCRLQGIRTNLFIGQSLAVIPLEEIQKELGENVVFEEYWPSYEETSKLLSRYGRMNRLTCRPKVISPVMEPAAGNIPEEVEFTIEDITDRE